ncbi:hypothetical protein Tco_1407580 [Tanacetum coccineum]
MSTQLCVSTSWCPLHGLDYLIPRVGDSISNISLIDLGGVPDVVLYGSGVESVVRWCGGDTGSGDSIEVSGGEGIWGSGDDHGESGDEGGLVESQNGRFPPSADGINNSGKATDVESAGVVILLYRHLPHYQHHHPHYNQMAHLSIAHSSSSVSRLFSRFLLRVLCHSLGSSSGFGIGEFCLVNPSCGSGTKSGGGGDCGSSGIGPTTLGDPISGNPPNGLEHCVGPHDFSCVLIMHQMTDIIINVIRCLKLMIIEA